MVVECRGADALIVITNLKYDDIDRSAMNRMFQPRGFALLIIELKLVAASLK